MMRFPKDLGLRWPRNIREAEALFFLLKLRKEPSLLHQQKGWPSHHEASLNDEEPIEHEFDIVDLDTHDEHQTLQQVIKENDCLTMELKENLERVKFIILFLERETSQLKAKQLVKEKEKFKVKNQEMKGKAMVDHEDTEQHEGNVSRKRPKTMVLRKAL